MMEIFLLIVLAVAASSIGVINGLKRAEVKIEEALSGIDVALVKRYDVLSGSLDALRGMMKYEKELIIETIRLRNGNMQERCETAEILNRAQSQILAVAERYPQLKSNENIKELQRQIQDCEEHLQAARRAYNANVSALNQKLVSFPTSVFAKMMGMCARDFFEAESYKKENVRIDL